MAEEKLRKKRHNRQMGLGYAILMLVSCMIILIVSGVAYGNYRDNQQDKRWCELLVQIDQPVPANAPQRTKNIQKSIHDLRVKFHC